MPEVSKQIEVYRGPTFNWDVLDTEPVVMTAERFVRVYLEQLCNSSAVNPAAGRATPIECSRLEHTAQRIDREVSGKEVAA